MYGFYDTVVRSLAGWRCRPGCSHCCTSLVILTSLEAAYLSERIPESVKERLVSCAQYAPALTMTTNEQASLCFSKTDFSEECAQEDVHPCPLLEDGRCACYDVRPLMCRMMFSTVACARTGYAEIPSPLLSLNTACLQLVEDLDSDGWFGYLVHLVPHLESPQFLERYRTGRAPIEDTRLRRNLRNPGLLVPPEHQEQVKEWLDALNVHVS